MKILRLVLEFFSRNKLPAIIVTVTFTLVLFIANNVFAQFRYITYTNDIFVATENKDSLYCMVHYDEDEIGDEGKINEIEEEAKECGAYTPFRTINGFNSIINGKEVYNYLFTKETAERYSLPLSSGNWSDLGKTDELNVIVSGKDFEYLNVGDTMELSIPEVEDSEIKVKVVGKLAAPYIIPMFSTAGSNLNTNEMYQYFNGLIFLDSSTVKDTVNGIAGYNVFSEQGNFMTAYKEGSSEVEKTEYLELLEEYGVVCDYDTIVSNSNEYRDKQLRLNIPTPMFLLIIVTIALISLSVLFVNKKLREHSIYYLCGCGRAKSYLIISCAIGLMGLIGGLVNIIFIYSYDYLVDSGFLSAASNNAIYDGKTMLFTLAYALLVSLISIVISAAVFRKSSPIEIYRKYEN